MMLNYSNYNMADNFICKVWLFYLCTEDNAYNTKLDEISIR